MSVHSIIYSAVDVSKSPILKYPSESVKSYGYESKLSFAGTALTLIGSPAKFRV